MNDDKIKKLLLEFAINERNHNVLKLSLDERERANDNEIQDLIIVKHCIEKHMRMGWSQEDIWSFILCLEEVNPSLDEGIALARQERIKSKYIQTS